MLFVYYLGMIACLPLIRDMPLTRTVERQQSTTTDIGLSSACAIGAQTC